MKSLLKLNEDFNDFAFVIKSLENDDCFLQDIWAFYYDEDKNLTTPIEFGNDLDKFIDVAFSSVAHYEDWKERRFRKLILLKMFKPEKLVFFTKKFIADELGELFID